MKTTLEIPDPLFRRAKALAARKGISLKQLVTDALIDKLESSKARGQEPAWKELAGALDELRPETRRVLARIEEDAETLDEDE